MLLIQRHAPLFSSLKLEKSAGEAPNLTVACVFDWAVSSSTKYLLHLGALRGTLLPAHESAQGSLCLLAGRLRANWLSSAKLASSFLQHAVMLG